MKRISDFLSWLGGAEEDILARVPHERARFVQMALVLLTTAAIAMVSMIFAMNDGVRVPLPVAVVTGVFWGFVILNLDRFLVLSMGATRAGWRLFLMAMPRLLLAMVISLVIATPLTLRIFQHDIDVQIAMTQATESKRLKGMEAQSGPAQEAGQVLDSINKDEQIMAGHLPVNVTNPQLQDAQTQVNQLEPRVTAARQAVITTREAYQCEIDGSGPGCAGASDKTGFGPIAQAKQAQYQQAQQAYNALLTQLNAASKNLAAAQASVSQSQAQTLAQDQQAARQALPGLKRQYAQLEQQVQQSENSAQAAVSNDNGILAQLSALSAASASNPVLTMAQLVVTLLFFFIEILPVMVKFLLNIGPLSSYETVAKTEEEKVTDKVRLDRIAARRDAERDSDEERRLKDGHTQVRVSVAEDMRKREEALGVHANRHVADEMVSILDTQLTEWSRRVQASLGGAPHGNGAQYGNGHFAGNGAQPGNGMAPPRQAWTPPPGPGFGLLPQDDDLL